MAAPNWEAIPAPSDDGACDHLLGKSLPKEISLPNTSGQQVNLASLPGLNIIFFYPRTAAPGENVPETWNSIPGARGCLFVPGCEWGVYAVGGEGDLGV
ncbi:hypothetical protein LTR86_010846 [Recurvomyces mirabilis]|nr:hypothetical protein LTR86_010846 [Recurvomyces mirabilis]